MRDTTTCSAIDRVLSTHYGCPIDIAFGKGEAEKALLEFQKLQEKHDTLLDRKIAEALLRTFPLSIKSE